jgi:predicted ATP-grasp superfamily ATP-dependent carboligase
VAVVLLTDSSQRSTLAACRSLARAGHEVHVAGSGRWSLAGASRGVREHIVDAGPLERPELFGAAVANLAQRIGAHVLIPMTDAAAIAILAGDQRATPYRVPMPGLEAFRLASDKAALLSRAQAAGFAIPESAVIESRSDGLPRRLEPLTPGVLKPHRSITHSSSGLQRHTVTYYANAGEAATILQSLPDEAFPVLAQRRVPGDGVGFFALRWEGRMVATFAHRRLREVPPTGGVSVSRESIAMPPELAAAGTRLLSELDWQGVAMVECKHDPASNRYYVIEVNPRFWGSLQLAIDAGVDFPALLVECALGGAPAPVTTYRTGLRSRWWWGEMDHVYLRAKLRPRGTSALGSLFSALGDVLRWSPGRDRSEILRWRDPGPFAVETLRRLGVLR